jgi:hypothetical protein
MVASDWKVDLRGLIEYPVPCGWWPMVAWALTPGERVSKAIGDAALEYAAKCGNEAHFAFIRTLPVGAMEFVEVAGVTLALADWVPVGFVVLARGGTQRIGDDFQHWRKVGGVG